MFNERTNTYLVKKIVKVVLCILCYLAFTLYTVPAYHNIRAYADEKFASKKSIIVGETPIIVEVLDEMKERERGLSNRPQLTEGTGVLFVFEEKGLHGFWMKDMSFSIDILWFNEYGELVYYIKNVSPDTYPVIFTPDEPAKYVIEVPAGFIKQEGIKIGDKIDLY
ncbi:MAG: hypothetical protein RLZZ517_371 [Candidatus Parcubacteria bacterium]|jgi:uncharacterized membrane protein (UPF0127 family)